MADINTGSSDQKHSYPLAQHPTDTRDHQITGKLSYIDRLINQISSLGRADEHEVERPIACVCGTADRLAEVIRGRTDGVLETGFENALFSNCFHDRAVYGKVSGCFQQNIYVAGLQDSESDPSGGGQTGMSETRPAERRAGMGPAERRAGTDGRTTRPEA